MVFNIYKDETDFDYSVSVGQPTGFSLGLGLENGHAGAREEWHLKELDWQNFLSFSPWNSFNSPIFFLSLSVCNHFVPSTAPEGFEQSEDTYKREKEKV